MAISQKWECHKVVEAFKIIEVEVRPTLGRENLCILIGKDGQGEVVNKEWVAKHLPGGDLHPSAFQNGYFVRYPDGYTSWSPASAFETGYTELQGA